MADLKQIDAFLKYWFDVLKLYLRVKLYDVCRWISQPSGKSKHKFFQKIALLGDDFALGFGDKIRLGTSTGVTNTLIKEISRDQRIKQNWSVFNLGVYGSTTRDWLPCDSTQGIPNHPHLLEAMLTTNSKLNGCKILGLLIGFNDYRASPEITPETTLENIKIIAQHLSELGFIVYIFTIPSVFSASSIQDENLKRSQLIKDYISCGDTPNVHLAVEIDESNFEFKRRSLYAQGSSYFNATGYARIAKDWFQIVVPDMVKQEFSLFRNFLGY